AGSALTVNVKVRPAVDLSGDYRLILVRTEEDVHGTTSAWAQSNYYNGSATVMTGRGINYNTQPGTIPAANMYYDHVARSIDPSTSGVAGVLPATMANGTIYTATLTSTIPAGADTTKSKYIVMLVNNANGAVLNSQNKDGVLSTAGVEEMSNGVNALSIYPNPAAQSANVEFSLETAGSVTVNVIDMNGRSIYSTITNMNSGTQKFAIPVSGFAAGLYNVIIGTDKGAVTEKLSVIK
ncbi:MAG: T9SS type A sorting domain-containing protein, partial [Taibaiella sp.]|nr:T9SS type A sorting domain-containing protein [Taibaiella sp.]